MRGSMKQKMDMTHGPLMKKIIIVALPLALSGILQLLFNAADLIVVGQFSNTPEQSLAAVSSNGALIHLIINLALGLAVGTNVIMSQAIGARDLEKANRILHSSILLSLICGVVMGLIGFFGARFFLTLMDVDEAIIDKAVLYLQIFFLGTPANLFYNFGSAILRAKGDTTRPMIFLSIAGVINVGLNIVLVVGGLDVAGVAIATIVSQYLSAILLCICLCKETDFCKLSFKKLKIHKRETLDVVRVGLPSGALSCCFSISNVIIQSAINGFGYLLVAGSSTANNLDGFVYTAMNAVSSSALTFASQNYGAKRYSRIRRVMKDGCLLAFAVWTIIAGALLLFPRTFAGFYTKDATVISYATTRIYCTIPFFFLLGFNEVFVSGLRSMNHTIAPVVISLFGTCLLRIVWVFTAAQIVHTPEMLYASYGISWILTLIVTLVYYIVCYKKLMKTAPQDALPNPDFEAQPAPQSNEDKN
ncbi:MAG: MATE family efflux transporter [Clostridia bacterium]|nr:MATE family efflux transporter [Clostridia bacterium]